MNASSVPKMTFAEEVITKRRLASHAVYPSRHPRLPPCPLLAPGCPRAHRLQPRLPGTHPAGCRLRRHGPLDLAVRRRTPAPGSALCGNPPQSAAGLLARPRRVGSPLQRRSGSAAATPAPATQATPGPRPDPGALPRPLRPRSRRGRPWPGQEWHHPLPRLRHGLPHLPRPTLHRRADGRPRWRPPQGGHPPPAPPHRGRRCAASIAPVRPGVLQRRRDPLLAGGTLPVPDAAGLPRSKGRPPQGAERLARVLLLEAQRLGPLHLARRRWPFGPGVGGRPRAQSPRPAGKAGTRAVDLWLLGLPAVLGVVAEPDVSAAVRDRVELPTTAGGEGQDVQPQAGGASVPGGSGVGVAERVGVVALCAAVDAAPRRAAIE